MTNIHFYDDHYHYSDDDDYTIDAPCLDCGSGDHSTGACQ